MTQSSSPLSIKSSQSEPTFRNILKESLPLLKSAIIPLVLIVIVMSIISSVIIVLTLSDFFWQQHTIASIIADVNTKIAADPSYQLSIEERDLQIQAVYLYIAANVFMYIYQFIPIISLFVLTPAKLYYLYSKDPEYKISWGKSLWFPFRDLKRAITAIFLFLFFTGLIPIGLMAFYIFGILFMIYGFFSFYSMILDEKVGIEVFRGGIFYTKDNIPKIIGILMIGVFLPMLINLFTNQSLMDGLGFTQTNFWLWIDPASRNYPMLFLYEFFDVFLLNVFFIWLPMVYTVAFDQIRKEKISKMEEIKSKLREDPGNKVKTIEISPNQTFYHCLNCNQKLPLSARKCPQCHRLYRLVIKKKN